MPLSGFPWSSIFADTRAPSTTTQTPEHDQQSHRNGSTISYWSQLILFILEKIIMTSYDLLEWESIQYISLCSSCRGVWWFLVINAKDRFALEQLTDLQGFQVPHFVRAQIWILVVWIPCFVALLCAMSRSSKKVFHWRKTEGSAMLKMLPIPLHFDASNCNFRQNKRTQLLWWKLPHVKKIKKKEKSSKKFWGLQLGLLKATKTGNIVSVDSVLFCVNNSSE